MIFRQLRPRSTLWLSQRHYKSKPTKEDPRPLLSPNLSSQFMRPALFRSSSCPGVRSTEYWYTFLWQRLENEKSPRAALFAAVQLPMTTVNRQVSLNLCLGNFCGDLFEWDLGPLASHSHPSSHRDSQMHDPPLANWPDHLSPKQCKHASERRSKELTTKNAALAPR